MKKYFLAAVVFFAVLLNATAQDIQSLESVALQMYENTVAGNYEAVAAGTYPKVFEFIPKEKMMEMLKGMLNGDGYSIKLLKGDPAFEFGPVKKINDGNYCLVKYDMLTKMTFKEPVGDAESKAMIENFKKAMQTNEVTFEAKSNSFLINKRADVIFVSNKLTANKWKYMNRAGHGLMVKVFDEKVVKEYGL
ncbi:hypothetical protein GR160_14710 [Flavobacterium sp. Sd200]|uniref:hypothetical protein n=1 Tax=Flavobacterium sp. Sd200 TaxID=2692211 RepID=UPI00136CEF02|nr:hypothetical protein [Flavobacterium sp. Sd200]MXN92478.1 hypothetical protein [Flavobacterium sp. Sd200]